MSTSARLLSLLFLLCLLGCSPGASEEGVPSPATADAPDAVLPEPADASVPGESAAPGVSGFCGAEGLETRPFAERGAFGVRRRDVAADFTLPTEGGDWTLSEQYTGCETYVFLSDARPTSRVDSNPLVHDVQGLARMIERSPRNVRYFFLSSSDEVSEVDEFRATMRRELEMALGRIERSHAEHFATRMEFVTVGVPALEGWVPSALRAHGQVFAIDRFQRVRELGSLADVTQYDRQLDAAGAWPYRDSVAYVAHGPLHYNHEAQVEARAADPQWTAVYALYDEPLFESGRNQFEVTLPAAEQMAGFDTLLVDLRHLCDPERPELGNCDAWDVIQALWLCDGQTCDIELARFITTYHREGRWLADASGLLAYLREGGNRRLQLRGVREGHLVSLRLLLGNEGKGGTPYAAQALWRGGAFNADYDANHAPLTVDVPADAVRATLHVLVTGHGFGSGDNCAEFCDHQHVFRVGDATHRVEHPEIGDVEGCLNQIGQGTVPNQYGTWWYARSSWCPGKQVDPWVFELTDQMVPGQPLTLSYSTNHGDVTGGNVELTSHVVFWK